MSVTLLVIFGAFATAWFGWRFVSRIASMPCPSSLAWMLDLNWDNNRVIEALDLTPGMRIADVGCGPGRLTVPIAEAVGLEGEVTALDMQEKMLARLAKRVTARGVENVRMVHGGAGDGLLPRAYFDRALLVTVLGEIPERVRALHEIAAALKPGGYLLISEVIGDPHYQRIATVRGFAAEVGLQFEDLRSGLFSYTVRLSKKP